MIDFVDRTQNIEAADLVNTDAKYHRSCYSYANTQKVIRAENKSIDLVISKLVKDSNNLGQWFKANYLKSNEDKCELLLNINAEKFILVGNVSICNSTEAKLLAGCHI